jgi:hypothetical protein
MPCVDRIVRRGHRGDVPSLFYVGLLSMTEDDTGNGQREVRGSRTPGGHRPFALIATDRPNKD